MNNRLFENILITPKDIQKKTNSNKISKKLILVLSIITPIFLCIVLTGISYYTCHLLQIKQNKLLRESQRMFGYERERAQYHSMIENEEKKLNEEIKLYSQKLVSLKSELNTKNQNIGNLIVKELQLQNIIKNN